MIWQIKMFANIIREDFTLDPVQMSLHSFHDGGARFTHILHPENLASDAVNQIGTFASHIFLAAVSHTSVGAGDPASMINHWTMIAISSFALIPSTL